MSYKPSVVKFPSNILNSVYASYKSTEPLTNLQHQISD